MARFEAYLESGDSGICMAHVPALPGCFVRAASREAALARLPAAIDEYQTWLRRHGLERLSGGESIEIEIGTEVTGLGPFDPGDAAALFAPDRMPIAAEEMEWYLRLMACSRTDLLALVRGLPEDLLSWAPDAASFDIGRILRHVGNAEEWYVSRLVAPETLPPEWEDDKALPILEFLDMERRTAVERLRQLTERERSAICRPTHWAGHPEEEWTARKALRRFLEHEREHTAQIRRILAARRQHLLARLAAERAGLWEQLLGVDERMLTSEPISEGWSVKDLLAHMAAWDRWEHQVMKTMADGEEPDLTAIEDYDAANKVFVAPWRDRSLAEVAAEVQAARREWVAWLACLPEEDFFRRRIHGGYDWSFYDSPVPAQWAHDAEHAGQIGTWRKDKALMGQAGPKAVLLAALTAAREGLLASAALIAAERRRAEPVCGVWTLQDLLGHIADWEMVGLEGLRDMAAGRPPGVEHIADIEGWNHTHVEARRSQSWETVWNDLHAARRSFLEELDGMDDVTLGRSFPFPWGGTGTTYQWVTVFVRHDREHAVDLR